MFSPRYDWVSSSCTWLNSCIFYFLRTACDSAGCVSPDYPNFYPISAWYHFKTTYRRIGQETAQRTQSLVKVPSSIDEFLSSPQSFLLKKREEDLRCSSLPTFLTCYTPTRTRIDISAGLKDRQRDADVMRRDKAIFESIKRYRCIIYTPMRLMDVITRDTHRFSTLYLAARYIGRANPSSLLP